MHSWEVYKKHTIGNVAQGTNCGFISSSCPVSILGERSGMQLLIHNSVYFKCYFLKMLGVCYCIPLSLCQEGVSNWLVWVVLGSSLLLDLCSFLLSCIPFQCLVWFLFPFSFCIFLFPSAEGKLNLGEFMKVVRAIQPQIGEQSWLQCSVVGDVLWLYLNFIIMSVLHLREKPEQSNSKRRNTS